MAALLIEINYSSTFHTASILLLIKVLTNSNIKDISYIVVIVLQKSISPYLAMLALTLIYMGWTSP